MDERIIRLIRLYLFLAHVSGLDIRACMAIEPDSAHMQEGGLAGAANIVRNDARVLKVSAISSPSQWKYLIAGLDSIEARTLQSGVFVEMPMPLSSQTKQWGRQAAIGCPAGRVDRALGGRVVQRSIAERAKDDGIIRQMLVLRLDAFGEAMETAAPTAFGRCEAWLMSAAG